MDNCLYCRSKIPKISNNLYTNRIKKFCCRKHKELYRHKNNTTTKELHKEKVKIRNYTYWHFKTELGNQCSLCGSKDNLEIHHKNYQEFKKENCVLVCRKCHREKVHNLQ